MTQDDSSLPFSHGQKEMVLGEIPAPLHVFQNEPTTPISSWENAHTSTTMVDSRETSFYGHDGLTYKLDKAYLDPGKPIHWE